MLRIQRKGELVGTGVSGHKREVTTNSLDIRGQSKEYCRLPTPVCMYDLGKLVPGDALNDHDGLAALQDMIPVLAVTINGRLHARGGLTLLLAEFLDSHPGAVVDHDHRPPNDGEPDGSSFGLELIRVWHSLTFLQIRIWIDAPLWLIHSGHGAQSPMEN